MTYTLEGVGDCLGSNLAGGFNSVSPDEEIQPWDLVMVRPREGTFISELLTRDGVDAIGKIFLGRTPEGVHLATLNPPLCIDLPLEEIEALHRVDGGIDVEQLSPSEQGAVVYLSQWNTGEPMTPINEDWRPSGAVGLSRLTGDMATRYRSRSLFGTIAGPTPELISDAVLTAGSLVSDREWTETETRRLRKIVPLQNIFYLRRLLDQVEDGVNQKMGFPKRRKPVR